MTVEAAEYKDYRLATVIVCLGLIAPVVALLDIPFYLMIGALLPETYEAACQAYLQEITPRLWISLSNSTAWSALDPCLMANIHAGVLLQAIAVTSVGLAGYRSLGQSPFPAAKLVRLVFGFALLSVAICVDVFALGWSTRLFLYQWHYPYAPHLLTWCFMMACYLVIFGVVSIPTIVFPLLILKRLRSQGG